MCLSCCGNAPSNSYKRDRFKADYVFGTQQVPRRDPHRRIGLNAKCLSGIALWTLSSGNW